MNLLWQQHETAAVGCAVESKLAGKASKQAGQLRHASALLTGRSVARTIQISPCRGEATTMAE